MKHHLLVIYIWLAVGTITGGWLGYTHHQQIKYLTATRDADDAQYGADLLILGTGFSTVVGLVDDLYTYQQTEVTRINEDILLIASTLNKVINLTQRDHRVFGAVYPQNNRRTPYYGHTRTCVSLQCEFCFYTRQRITQQTTTGVPHTYEDYD